MQNLKYQRDKDKKKTSSMKYFPKQQRDSGISIGESGALGQMINRTKKQAEGKLTQNDKVQIVSTLLGINGSMKEFSEDLEYRLKRAYKDKAGKKYGLSQAQLKGSIGKTKILGKILVLLYKSNDIIL